MDGEGTLITTEQCLLNPNRNPEMSREAIEDELTSRLGVQKIVWLRWGHFEDEHTDGHVDGVCTYVRPRVVVAQTCEDPANPNYRLMAENIEVLSSETDAARRPFEVIELPFFPYYDLDGVRLMVSYANFYLANGGVVVPIANHPLDCEALSVLKSAFPDRDVVGVPGRIHFSRMPSATSRIVRCDSRASRCSWRYAASSVMPCAIRCPLARSKTLRVCRRSSSWLVCV